MLPQSIAKRLKRRPESETEDFTERIADRFSEVTVLFADIVEFTNFSSTLSAERLVGVLNDIFTRFDSIADCRGLEKIKTIGDAYMAAAGLPIPVAIGRLVHAGGTRRHRDQGQGRDAPLVPKQPERKDGFNPTVSRAQGEFRRQR